VDGAATTLKEKGCGPEPCPQDSPRERTDSKNSTFRNTNTLSSVRAGMQKIERREWWLWSFAVLVTLLLTIGVISSVFPMSHTSQGEEPFSSVPNSARGLVGMVLLFDIYTVYQQLQIHRMRRKLVEGEELFRLITENAADMIAVVDVNGERLYNSPSYQRLLGYSPEELRDTSSLEQVHPEDRELVKGAAREAIAAGTGRSIEYRMRHKEGGWRTLESTASPITDAEGRVEKLVIVNRDISTRRRLEEQLRQAQKMEAVGRLSGGIAHDFNNLLGIIIGYGEIMDEELDPANPLRESVEEVLKAGHQAASLTRQLLAFSRQQVLAVKVVDLSAVVSEVEKMLGRLIGEDIELVTVSETELGRVKTDQGQIEQVILNLAVNARDAMPHGGKLIIETSNVDVDEVFAQQSPYPIELGSYVCLAVRDTGVGMDTSIQARIFEPFFTTKEKGKGTGLGLSMVYGFVKQSGGYISVYSELGTGTTFKIYLPRVDAPFEREPARASVPTSLQGTETVLLVEDETGLRTLTCALLERCGYKVLAAQNATEALETSQRYKGPIHLMLTDVVMPGANGRVLAQQLVQNRPEIKVVYMSGYTGQIFSGHGILDPGSHFLAKPFTRNTLARRIREALDGLTAEAAK
jgi:two-component system cell cycle sensor histidine kinase/response regulator CckA